MKILYNSEWEIYVQSVLDENASILADAGESHCLLKLAFSDAEEACKGDEMRDGC